MALQALMFGAANKKFGVQTHREPLLRTAFERLILFKSYHHLTSSLAESEEKGEDIYKCIGEKGQPGIGEQDTGHEEEEVDDASQEECIDGSFTYRNECALHFVQEAGSFHLATMPFLSS